MQEYKCRICNAEIPKKQMAIHLKSLHNSVSHYDYVCKYIEDFDNWKKCGICNIVSKGKFCSRDCHVKWRHTIVGESHARFGKHFTDGQKEKISKIQIKRLSDPKNKEYLIGDLNSSKRPEVREKISKTRIESGVAVGDKNGMYGKTHTPEAIKKIFSHKKMNKFEKGVADLLDENRIKYKFQYFINDNGICKSYDFKIKNKPFIIECDGDFWHGNPNVEIHWKDSDKVKENDILKEQMAKDRGLSVIRIWESEFKENPRILIDRLITSGIKV